MNLIPVDVDSIRLGQPLPFTLRDGGGVLLAPKGYVVMNRADLTTMEAQRGKLCIDVTESEAHHRAYVGKLHTMVREDMSLGQIAGTAISSSDLDKNRNAGDDGTPDWLDLQTQANTLLRDHTPGQFQTRLDKLQAQLNRHSNRNPDGTLFALIHLSASEVRMYSATHAMLVSVMCGLAARDVLNWPPEIETTLCKAALTMNLGMTELQDRLAAQMEPPSVAQRRQIDEHATRSVTLLEQMGIADADWLDAVRDHHANGPGKLSSRTTGKRMARLMQRADMFAARLAPRASRQPTAPATAMQAIYFDEERQIDEAGAALIKAVGIYQPGSFVRLATNEIAVVIRRGGNTTTPRVAILVNRQGMPTGEHVMRDTSQRDFRIVASVAHREVKVKINLDRLLGLTSLASDRPW
jgi:HD-GYP domain-containing protein (c-di-GMP phosphodiesterase class II)